MSDASTTARRSRFRRRTAGMTRRGKVVLAIGIASVVIGYLGGYHEAVVVGCFAIVLAVIGVVFVRLVSPRLEVVRVFSPPVVPAGSPVRVSLAVRNLSARPTFPGWWNDGLPWWEEAVPQRMPSLASAPGGSPGRAGLDRTAVFSYALHPERRGVFRVGPLAIENGDPFGMATSVSAQGEQDELVVVPAVSALPGGALSTAEAEGDAMLVRRRVTGNEDDLTTREYRPGDALRRVHWRASARRGELMVRQEEQRSYPQVRVLLDTRRDGYPDAGPGGGVYEAPEVESDTFEWAVRLYASLAIHLLGEGFDVVVGESGPAQVAPLGDRFEGGLREEAFLASLAPLHLVPVRRGERPPDAPSAAGPLFAILGTPNDETVEWVRRQRRPGELAVVFLGGEHSDDAADRLRDHGWVVVQSDDEVDPVDVWAAAHEVWGARRGPR